MFLPFTMRAVDMGRFTPQQLTAPQSCMCGKEVKLSDCLISWGKRKNKSERELFATCGMGCLVIHLSEGEC